MDEQVQELDTLLPEPRVVTIGAHRIEVRPIRVKQLARFVRAVGPVFDAFAANDIERLLTEHSEQVIEAVGIAIERDAVWMGELELDELAELAGAVIEVNLDFFVRRLVPKVLPQIQAMAERMARMAGPTPSSA